MIAYKLTNEKLRTYDGFQWTVGEWQTASGEGLCEAGTLHYYNTPEVAAVMNPCHADIKSPVLWEIEVEGETICDGVKSGLLKGRMRLVRKVDLPTFTKEQLRKIGVRVTRLVLERGETPEWDAWADAVESGTATEEMREAAYAATWTAWLAAARAAGKAAEKAAGKAADAYQNKVEFAKKFEQILREVRQ